LYKGKLSTILNKQKINFISVGCTKSEPCPGWVKGIIGPPGFIIPIIIGFWRVLNADLLKRWDLIPADYIVNALICVMWDTVNM